MLNEMMHRPVVMQELVDYMRKAQQGFEGGLGQIEAYANERGIPVIPHETAKFIDFFCATVQPKDILEIGTAIGFSASLMAQHLATDGHLTTIDRYPKMFERAKENFKLMGLEDRVTLIEGDAAEVLPSLSGQFDLIFMDSAKAKYIEFYPHCMRLLKMGGVLIIDDIFQGGTILEDEKDRPKRVRKIHRKLNELLDHVLGDKSQRSCLVPLGDGLLMVRKESEYQGQGYDETSQTDVRSDI
ncbi:TPA: O-methyltransferase [Streptococcus suis]